MAVLQADRLFETPYIGEDGNASVAWSKSSGASVANGTDTIDFMTLPGSSILYDWQMICNAATGGTSPTMSLGWRYADGTSGGSATALLAATSNASAARTRAGALMPIEFDKDIIIYGTSGGSGTSTAVDTMVVAEYRFKGTK